MELLKEMRQMFIDESINSPMLLSDLANMEKYISESYSGRSLIELLQNADDAGASEFFVKKLDNETLIVANNGRPFNKEDVISLCRSGASTKQRKSSTIGFRGIGFKSVVNYSNEVYLVSNNFRILFSRELTQKLLNTNILVPLIRIPHEFNNCEYDKEISELLKTYNSVFIFKTINNSFDKEVAEFDQSCLLFLNNVRKIVFGNNDLYYASRKFDISNNLKRIELESNIDKPIEWLIYNDLEASKISSVAFKYYDNKVIPANADESVIHSFMPTKDRLSIPFKINGDFSTDPSRTKIVIDEESLNAIDECIKVLISLLNEIKFNDRYDIMNILSYAKQDPLSSIRGKTINDLIIEKLSTYLKDNLFANSFVKPSNIDDTDFITICNNLKVNPILDSVQSPNVSKFAHSAGIIELPISDCLSAMGRIECSELTRAEILNKTIKQTKFGTNNDVLNNFSNAKIFTSGDKVVSARELNDHMSINENFIETTTSKLESVNDYQNFMKKLGLGPTDNNIKISKINSSNLINIPIPSIKRKSKVIKKWRSVEQNVAAVLETIKDNYSVLDVSEQNLGYDIEVVTSNGEKEFYEVKSVEYFGESISITNNEYTTANQYKDKYILAITCQSDNDIEICFVRNPIDTLSLTKRIVRWEWICSTYNGKMIKKQFDENGAD